MLSLCFPRLSPLRAYVKAWNTKVIPIFLTVTSTILGFVPFMVGMEKEGFWFPLAAGTIGGLIMSVIGVFIFLPVFTLKKKCLVKPKATLYKSYQLFPALLLPISISTRCLYKLAPSAIFFPASAVPIP